MENPLYDRSKRVIPKGCKALKRLNARPLPGFSLLVVKVVNKSQTTKPESR